MANKSNQASPNDSQNDPSKVAEAFERNKKAEEEAAAKLAEEAKEKRMQAKTMH